MTSQQIQPEPTVAHPGVAGDRPPAGDDHARRAVLAGLPVSERQIDAAGISTAVLEGGTGLPIVLLHGANETAANWRWVIAGLARTHRVVAPDLPAHGSTDAPEGSVDPDRVLAWLGEVISRTCDAVPALVGHVLGGAIAARFACRRRGELEHLVLVDSLGLGRFRPSPRFAARLIRVQAQSPKAKAAGRLFRVLGLPRIPPAELERISTPTTLIWGRHDRASRLRVAERASARYGWPLQVIEDAAGDPARDQPEAFMSALHVALGRTVTAPNAGR